MCSNMKSFSKNKKIRIRNIQENLKIKKHNILLKRIFCKKVFVRDLESIEVSCMHNKGNEIIILDIHPTYQKNFVFSIIYFRFHSYAEVMFTYMSEDAKIKKEAEKLIYDKSILADSQRTSADNFERIYRFFIYGKI